jgi:large conductance mechanosensitive channel
MDALDSRQIGIERKGASMLQRVRAWSAETPTGITVTVGVTMGYAIFQFLLQSTNAFVLPFLLRWRSADEAPLGRLTFHLGSYKFDYTTFTVYGFSVLVLGMLGYFLFCWQARADVAGSSAMRECPECKSEISVEATRCAFCTSAVSPVAG